MNKDTEFLSLAMEFIFYWKKIKYFAIFIETFMIASYINVIEKASLLMIYLGEVIAVSTSLIGSFLRQA